MVTLAEHILVKVKEDCNTRPTLTKTVLARVDEVICLQEIDPPVLDNGLKDFSLSPLVYETLSYMKQMFRQVG